MKQLDFTLSLIDKLSRPLKQVQGNVTGFAEKSKAAFMQIGGGAGRCRDGDQRRIITGN